MIQLTLPSPEHNRVETNQSEQRRGESAVSIVDPKPAQKGIELIGVDNKNGAFFRSRQRCCLFAHEGQMARERAQWVAACGNERRQQEQTQRCSGSYRPRAKYSWAQKSKRLAAQLWRWRGSIFGASQPRVAAGVPKEPIKVPSSKPCLRLT